MEIEEEKLIRYIEQAFQSVAYPGDENIVDNPEHCPECIELYEFLKGKHWKDIINMLSINPLLLIKYYDKFPLLTQKAKLFYLPLYLISVIKIVNILRLTDNSLYFIKDLSRVMVDFIVYCLSDVNCLNYNILNRSQKRSILIFLDYIQQQLTEEDPLKKDIIKIKKYLK